MAEVCEVLLGHPSGAWQSTSVSGSLMDSARTVETWAECDKDCDKDSV